MKNYKIFLLTIVIFLASCSKGKLEYRKSSTGCIAFPELLQRAYTDTSTTMKSDEIIDTKIKALLPLKDKLQEDSREVYLINTTNSDVYSFTVKFITKEPFPMSKTVIYKLNPGEEILLGCDIYINEGAEVVKQDFSIVGQRKD